MSTADDTANANFLRSFGIHKGIFIAVYGPWPHPCVFCGEPIAGYVMPRDKRAAVVHHLDHNHYNNVPENLAPAHNACHTRHHATGRIVTVEQRAAMSLARLGTVMSAETRAKVSAAKVGTRHTEEAKAKIGAAFRGVPRTPADRATMAAAWQKPGFRKKMKAARTGKKRSAQARANMSAAMRASWATNQRKPRKKGEWHQSPEAKAKIGAANKSRVCSSETRAKMSAAQRANTREASCIRCRQVIRVAHVNGLRSHLSKCLGVPYSEVPM